MSEFLSHLDIDQQRFAYLDLHKLLSPGQLARLPYSLRILLENIARCAPAALPGVLARATGNGADCEVPFQPNRLMFHDTTCLPALADFAGMRDVVAELGGDPRAVNPSIPAVLTIDHSVIVEHYAEAGAVEANLAIDFRRNSERYRFIKWAQASLDNFKVIPPGTGIIHQMNMESIAQVVWESTTADGQVLLHPDCMVATDSHTPMINAIGVLGWGVGGLEGQAAMLGEPVPIPYPQVVGIRVSNALRPGVSATDLALTVTELLRRRSMVGKFVEFTGPGLASLSWAARGTVANMAPEYGATVVFFPFDDETLSYLTLSARPTALVSKVSAYMAAQSLWRRESDAEPQFDELIELDLATVEPSVAGPHQPHQRQSLATAAASFHQQIPTDTEQRFFEASFDVPIGHGAVVMSAITSCTNTANPAQMIQAGLLARNARARGVGRKPWVKTSLSPGSRVVADYLEDADLLRDFAALGFELAGFGCMTCIGNSGSLESHVETFADQGLKGVVVLSGNRNFEGRVNPKVPAGYLASPALCVAYAIAGSIDIDMSSQPLAVDGEGRPVYLHELMPSEIEVEALVSKVVRPSLFRQRQELLWQGTHHWQALEADGSVQFAWQPQSTYLRRPQYLAGIGAEPAASLSIANARALVVLGDNVTTDHISPAGTIPAESLAGHWLRERGEALADLNQYSTRRSNHEVMVRGAFTNPRLNNLLDADQPARQGVWAWNADRSEYLPLYQAAQNYIARGTPTVLLAGINYGAGSSRDWAAKVLSLLGIKVVVARSIERIHRSNLIGMGVLPLVFKSGAGAMDLRLDGSEALTFEGLDQLSVGENPITLVIRRVDGKLSSADLLLRLDSLQELGYLEHGGVLPFVVRKTVKRTRQGE
ncbi:aconitate hydratase AcnA [Pseudomonas gingeri]|uniref:aconitate hydratase AcnA n=1 Tax=Pseudomonas gingeri TaxID=117681 RepID=UPI0015A0DF78|nr:aconitate hydratase AcnA [Pseudomonas gingeri]NWA03449.1 aconitate hydratase AcnA [Pseudomonas gingeri]NWA14307.1 aconitate hydratase AcnA [Pseudomonas gingeri]NWA55075.1 aconitate hydratase AcnA [Pseudomonas gingeri]NWA94799.1 aconitate hydratase AcnA [Pseudomonas gingeri]NWB01455.1 aconitate hydratase AcnA [Pseudomonas gingeri]